MPDVSNAPELSCGVQLNGRDSLSNDGPPRAQPYDFRSDSRAVSYNSSLDRRGTVRGDLLLEGDAIFIYNSWLSRNFRLGSDGLERTNKIKAAGELILIPLGPGLPVESELTAGDKDAEFRQFRVADPNPARYVVERFSLA